MISPPPHHALFPTISRYKLAYLRGFESVFGLMLTKIDQPEDLDNSLGLWFHQVSLRVPI